MKTPGWAERRQARRRIRREQRGDSPEKQRERHSPNETVIDRMLRLGGVERESRFKKF